MAGLTLGQLLRSSRKRHRGMTQREVGDALGVSQATISAWERDRWRPPKSQWRKLCDVLGVTRRQIEEALARTQYPLEAALPSKPEQMAFVGSGSGKTMAMVRAILAALERHDATPGRDRPDVMTLTWPDGTVTIIEAKAGGGLAKIDERLEHVESVMAQILERMGDRSG